MLRFSQENRQLTFGVFAGSVFNRSEAYALNRTKGKVTGYGFGLYGTFETQPQSDQGWYVDTWLSWNRFRNRIETSGNTGKYNAQGVVMSAETGYGIPLGSYANDAAFVHDYRFIFTPQLQVIRSGVRSDTFRDEWNNEFASASNRRTTMRLGAQLSVQTSGGYGAYAQVDWLHQSRAIGVRASGRSADASGTRDQCRWEAGARLKTGTQSEVRLALQAAFGADQYRAYRGSLTWKMHF